MKRKTLLVALVLIISCQSPNTPPLDDSEKTFELKYELKGMVTADGKLTDPEIKAAFLESITYYPKINKSNYRYHLFQNYEFKKIPSMKPDWPVYFGCEREFEIQIAKDWDTTDVFIEWKVYHFPMDTIKSFADSVFLVTWPTDAVKADTTFFLN